MKKKIFQLIVAYLIAMVAYTYCISYVALAYVYKSYPGQELIAVLFSTLPCIFGMASAFIVGPLMRFISKKTLLIIGLAIGFIGGMIVYFGAGGPLPLMILGSALTGVPAGIIAPINNSVLPTIAPEKIRASVVGWNDACMAGGLVVINFISGLLLSGGNWNKTYAFCFYYILLIILALLFYPNVGINSEENQQSDVSTKEQMEEKIKSSRIPTFVIGMILVQLLASFFNPTFLLNCSNLIIFEMELGDAVFVGTVNAIASAAGVIAGLLISLWLKKLKGASVPMAIILCGVFYLVVILIPTKIGCLVGSFVLAGTMILSQSGKATYIALGYKGKKVGTALSTYSGVTYFGEFVAGYIVPFLAPLIFGTASSMSNIRLAGIGLIIVGIISIPFCIKANAQTFGSKAVDI